MAWALVGRKQLAWADSSTSKDISLTDLTGGLASAPAAGDVVVFFYYHGVTSSAYTLGVSTSGYSTKSDANAASPGVSALAGVKVMGGTPDTTLTLTTSNGFNGMSRLVLIEVWRGGSGTQPDVAIVSANGSSGNANPPAVTPSTTGARIIYSGGNGSYGPISAYTSSDLSDFTQGQSTDGATVDVRGATGYKDWVSGSTDAAAFGAGGGIGWAAFAVALRPDPTQTLAPSLVTNSQTFHAPTVSRGPVSLVPPLLGNNQTFHAPTVSPGPVSLTPALLTNAQEFFDPEVGQFGVLLAPRINNSQSFYPATVSAGPVSLAAPLLTNAQSFPASTVSPGPVSLAPPLLTNAEAFFAPGVLRVVAAVTPAERAVAFSASIAVSRSVLLT